VDRVVDAHHHVWAEPGLDRYPWMAGNEMEPLRRRFGFAELKPQMAAAGIDATVVVQARTDLEETHALLALARAEPAVAGVVGWVDLTDGRTGETLARLRERSGGEKLVGVRHPAHDEPDPDWLARPDVLRGAEEVAEAGLAMDLLVRTRELPAALRLVRALPGLTCVVDHLAKPPLATGDLTGWRRRMAPLGEQPHVTCKLSGLVTEARWDAWRMEELAACVEDALAWFGPERLLFGTDWPVCTLAATHAEVVRAYRTTIAHLAPGERAQVMGGTAARVYRLG
jgi:L-fucono-1,5-lactonase